MAGHQWRFDKIKTRQRGEVDRDVEDGPSRSVDERATKQPERPYEIYQLFGY